MIHNPKGPCFENNRNEKEHGLQMEAKFYRSGSELGTWGIVSYHPRGKVITTNKVSTAYQIIGFEVAYTLTP